VFEDRTHPSQVCCGYSILFEINWLVHLQEMFFFLFFSPFPCLCSISLFVTNFHLRHEIMLLHGIYGLYIFLAFSITLIVTNFALKHEIMLLHGIYSLYIFLAFSITLFVTNFALRHEIRPTMWGFELLHFLKYFTTLVSRYAIM